MTRARHHLHLMVPQRFYVTQQSAYGDRHLYGSLSRFLPEAVHDLFDAIVPAVNKSVSSDKLTTALNALSAALTTDELIALNKKVDIDGGDPATVAKDWLTSKGLA